MPPVVVNLIDRFYPQGQGHQGEAVSPFFQSQPQLVVLRLIR